MSHPDLAPDREEFYLGDPHRVFRRLRAEDPVAWYEEGEFWCVTKHSDLRQVSLDPKIYSSAHGTQIFEIPLRRDGQQALGDEAPTGVSIIQMDPPQHNQHRKLLIHGFTPRMVRGLEVRIREIARESLDAVPLGEVIDFVECVSLPLPMLIIAELLGVPDGDIQDFRRWSDAMIEAGGGGVGEKTVQTIGELYGYFGEMIQEYEKRPGENLLSILAHSEIEGRQLTHPEILMFCMTLLVAGNETTRNLISVGSRTLLEHPEQLQKLVEDPSKIPNAVEEMLRHATPVMNFARRALCDTTLRGKKIAQGDYLVLFYGSANRDEEIFGDDSDSFDVARPNAGRHLAFGYGEHLCMGASLARLEARVLFEELFARRAHFELAGPVKRLSSILINGIDEMPVVFKQ